MTKFKIRHVTRYSYELPVRDSANQIMLYPLQDEHQEVVHQAIVITGDPQVSVHRDYFGNEVGTFMHSHPHSELVIDSRLTVKTGSRNPPEDKAPATDQWSILERLRSQSSFIDFLKVESFTGFRDLERLTTEIRNTDATPLAASKAFCGYVFEQFTYKKGITTVESTLDEVWAIKTGVCQDFAHILLEMLRICHVPARYVSGYICPSKGGMRGEGATHAWVEAFLPNFGWLGLDPTNNCVAGENHVRLAVGKNFSDCSPVKGTYRGVSEHTLEVAVMVSYEDGHTAEETMALPPETAKSFSQNSYRRHQEMQMQQ